MGSQAQRVSRRGGRRRVYVACGDSNTAARVDPRPYPVQCSEHTERHFTSFVNAGRGGWTITDLRDNLDALVLVHRPAVVSLMFGTNDHAIRASHPGPQVSLADFRAHYSDVVGKLIDAGARPILLTPPFTVEQSEPGTTNVSNIRLREYATVVRDVAAKFAAALIDVHQITTDLCGGSEAVWIEQYAFPASSHIRPNTHAIICGGLLPELVR